MNTLVAPYLRLWRAASPEVRGIVLMSVSTFCFVAMHTMIRYLSTDLSAFQIAFFRNVFGILVFVPVMLRSGLGFMRTERLGMHALRSVFNIGAMLMFFSALALTDVAHATALGFSAPVFAAVLSVVVLGERFRIRRWIAILCGVVGVVLIVRPGYIPFELGPMLVVGSAFFWSICLILIKLMSRTESSLTIVAYMNIFLTLYALGPALWFWEWPSAEGWVLLAALSVMGTLGQLMVSQSLKETEPTVVMPFDFLKLIWAAFLGFIIFGEIPDQFVWIGGALIFGSSFYLAWRESQIRKAAAQAGR